MPGTLIGAWIGMRAYQALSDRNFYDVVLGLLFLSGLGLVWSSIGTRSASALHGRHAAHRRTLYARDQTRYHAHP